MVAKIYHKQTMILYNGLAWKTNCCMVAQLFLFLSSFLLYIFFLLLDFHLWKLSMENKTDSVLVNMAVEDLIGDGNDTKIGEIAGDGPKRIFFGEFGAEVPMIPVIAPLVDILIK